MRAVAFRAARDRLFARHPSSPVPEAQRRDFRGVAYFRYAPELALQRRLEPDPDAPPLQVPRSGTGEQIPFHRIGWVSFTVDGTPCRLAVFWLTSTPAESSSPSGTRTGGRQTYGGGRYLWDSAKGADLGSAGDELMLDFNFAYHPSCVYDPIWSCPLAPQENWLRSRSTPESGSPTVTRRPQARARPMYQVRPRDRPGRVGLRDLQPRRHDDAVGVAVPRHGRRGDRPGGHRPRPSRRASRCAASARMRRRSAPSPRPSRSATRSPTPSRTRARGPDARSAS